MGAPEPVLCPSAPCTSGSQLLGIVLRNGRIAFAATPLVVDGEFVRAAEAVGVPERYFRFASPCAQGGCAQWTGKRCGVIATVLGEAPETEPAETLPDCLIRASCRWYLQAGAEACHVCPAVVTDGTTS